MERFKKKRTPAFTSKMSQEQKAAIVYKKVVIIQKIWRQLMASKRFNVMQLGSKQQKLKLLSRFKQFEIYASRIVILYCSIEEKFIMTFTIYELEREPVVYDTFIMIQTVMQYVFGYNWDKIDRDEPVFTNRTLPLLARKIAESLELSTDDRFGDHKAVCCKLHFEVPQQLNLLRKENPYALKREDLALLRQDESSALKLQVIIKLQRAFKLFKARKIVREAFFLKKHREIIERNNGKLVKNTYHKISGDFFRVAVRSKITSNEEFLRFQIMPAPGGPFAKTEKAFLWYKVSENKFLNCQGLELIDFLIQLIRKTPDAMSFYFLEVKQRFQPVSLKNEFAEELSDDEDAGNVRYSKSDREAEEEFEKVSVANLDQYFRAERHGCG